MLEDDDEMGEFGNCGIGLCRQVPSSMQIRHGGAKGMISAVETDLACPEQLQTLHQGAEGDVVDGGVVQAEMHRRGVFGYCAKAKKHSR